MEQLTHSQAAVPPQSRCWKKLSGRPLTERPRGFLTGRPGCAPPGVFAGPTANSSARSIDLPAACWPSTSHRRPGRHLGSQPLRVVPDPVRHRQNRRDHGVYQPCLSAVRTGICTQQVQCKVLITAEKFRSSDYLGMLRDLAPELSQAEPGRLGSETASPSPGDRMGDETSPGMLNFPRVLGIGR